MNAPGLMTHLSSKRHFLLEFTCLGRFLLGKASMGAFAESPRKPQS